MSSEGRDLMSKFRVAAAATFLPVFLASCQSSHTAVSSFAGANLVGDRSNVAIVRQVERGRVGNETNKGILLSPEDNAIWTLDWDRNAALFNEAIKAVKDFEEQSNTDIKIMPTSMGYDRNHAFFDM